VRRPVNVLTRRDRPQWGSREVWFVQEALRRVGEARHLRPSRDHVAGGLEIQALLQRHRLGRTHSRTADKRVLRRCRTNQSGGSR
jgi:hypothetical protein